MAMEIMVDHTVETRAMAVAMRTTEVVATITTATVADTTRADMEEANPVVCFSFSFLNFSFAKRSVEI